MGIIGRGDPSWRADSTGLVVGTVLVVLAVSVEVLSLRSLGRQYAFEMQIKPGHSVVNTGMYRFVRHPIYLANNVGFLGIAVLAGHWTVWLAVVAHFMALLRMAESEDRFLVRHLGEDYKTYRSTVRWMILPGVI
ncbi:MAG: methyltransferase family protein [Patescibacteria group bacterium]